MTNTILSDESEEDFMLERFKLQNFINRNAAMNRVESKKVEMT